MSLSNRRRGRVSPPPAKYDPEWENQLRRAFEESILKPDDFTNSYPFNSPYLSGGRIEVTQISNVTGGWSNVTGEYTKTSPHDEESETDGSHHWVMRQWRPPSYCGTAYYASPSRLPESVSVYPNVSGFRLDYDNLAPWSSYDAIADALASTDTKICFQALVGYSAQATLMGGAVSRVDDEMLAETKSYWQMSLADLRDGVASHALSIANYQYVSNNASGSLLPDQGILDVTSPLEAVDNPGAYCTTIRINATAADKYLYSTGVDTWAEGAITTFGRSLLDDADATAGRNTLGASTGVWGLAVGGTAADLSATGGTGQFLRQSSAGAAVTVSAIGHADLGSGGGGSSKYLREDMSWQTVSAGVTGSGVANQVAYWSGASALTGDADLVFNGTQLLTTGLFVGALTGTPARALEVRSTSAQIRGSYDATNYWEIAADATGNLSVTGSGSAAFKVNIGPGSTAAGASCTVLGAGASAAGNESVSIGRNSACAAASCVAIGNTAAPGANNNSIAIGYAAVCTGSPGIALGRAASAGANELVVGSSAYPSNNWFGGKGVTNATPTTWTLNGTGGSGTDIAGGALCLGGGKPTGAGVGGSVVIKTAPAGASGTTLRSLVDRLTVDQKGNIYPGTAALATGATDGFLYIQTCAGTPTGVPTTVTGRIAIVYDTTNKKLYAYNGAWESVTFA